jgi:hypothetical protein
MIDIKIILRNKNKKSTKDIFRKTENHVKLINNSLKKYLD